MTADPLLGTGIFLLGGVAASLYLLPLRWTRRWSYERSWLMSVLLGWLVFPLVFDAFFAPGTLSIVFAEPLLVAKTVGFGVIWGVGALAWALMVRYLGVGLGLAIGAGLCAATGTLLPPVLTGRAASLVATPGARLVLAGVALSLIGIALVGAAGRLKEGEMDEAAKKKAVADYDFKKGLFTAVLAGVASAGINFGLQGAPEWEAAALARGIPAVWTGMPVLTAVLWGGVLTQTAWVIWKTGRSPVRRGLGGGGRFMSAGRNFFLCAVTGVTGMSQFLFQKVGEPLMGEMRYISFAVLMASSIFFATAVGAALGEWKGVRRRTFALLLTGLAVLLSAFVIISLGGRS